MAHTFTNLLTHVIFSTRGRAPLIHTEFQHSLHAYMGGIIRELDGKALAIDGTADHVHLLLWMPPIVSLSDTMRVLKANSSRWVRKTHQRRDFSWQEGYGAFSVSQSSSRAVVRYIHDQQEHHRLVSFQDEFIEFLRKHGIQYDERYIWE